MSPDKQSLKTGCMIGKRARPPKVFFSRLRRPTARTDRIGSSSRPRGALLVIGGAAWDGTSFAAPMVAGTAALI